MLAFTSIDKSRCDVLDLCWVSSGRDREVDTPICHALRYKGYKVVETDIFNYRYHIWKHRPRLIFMRDPRGAVPLENIVAFANMLGIPVVNYVAEGQYTTFFRMTERFLGKMDANELQVEAYLQWSSVAKQTILEEFSDLSERIPVCGGVGFDRYKMYEFAKKNDFTKHVTGDYEYVFGYAGWAFDHYYWREDADLLSLRENTPERLQLVRQTRDDVHSWLKTLICRHENTLFLLKEHPGVLQHEYSELAGLQEYPNTIYIRNETPVADCINACDLWMAFDSTTCMEAWLLDTPTLLLNPMYEGYEDTFSRIQMGTPVLSKLEDVEHAIDTFLAQGILPGFAEKSESREQEIKSLIQWKDGKNHLRAAYIIGTILERPSNLKFKFSLQTLAKMRFWHIFLNASKYIKWFRNNSYTARRFCDFDPEQVAVLRQKYGRFLNRFYEKNALTENDIQELMQLNSEK